MGAIITFVLCVFAVNLLEMNYRKDAKGTQSAKEGRREESSKHNHQYRFTLASTFATILSQRTRLNSYTPPSR